MTDSAQTAAKRGIDPREAAYLRFETPEEEIRKFMRRLRRLGVSQWPRETNVVELFCDHGNGLHAMARLGFRNIEGLDLSPRLLADYERQTYESWLARPREISPLANRYFQPELETFA